MIKKEVICDICELCERADYPFVHNQNDCDEENESICKKCFDKSLSIEIILWENRIGKLVLSINGSLCKELSCSIWKTLTLADAIKGGMDKDCAYEIILNNKYDRSEWIHDGYDSYVKEFEMEKK